MSDRYRAWRNRPLRASDVADTPSRRRRRGALRRAACLCSPVVGVAVVAALGLSVPVSGAEGSRHTARPALTIDGAKIYVDQALAKQVPATVRKTGLKDISYNDTPPDEFVSGGALQGQEVDMGRAVAAVLGLTWHATASGAFTTFIPSLQDGRFNTSFTSFIVTPARVKVINIVSIYAVGTGFAAKPGSGVKPVKNALDLCGDSVAVIEASAYITYMNGISAQCKKAGKPSLSVHTFPSEAAAELAVEDGRDQLYSSTATGIAYIIHQTHKLVLEPFDLKPQPEGAGVTKGKLGAVIADAVNVLIRTGAYHTIMHRWGETAFMLKHSINY